MRILASLTPRRLAAGAILVVLAGSAATVGVTFAGSAGGARPGTNSPDPPGATASKPPLTNGNLTPNQQLKERHAPESNSTPVVGAKPPPPGNSNDNRK